MQVSVLEPEFLACGGDVKWLHGLHHLPPKLHSLLKLNRLLAHQPWNVSPGDIKVGMGGREGEALERGGGGGGKEGGEGWGGKEGAMEWAWISKDSTMRAESQDCGRDHAKEVPLAENEQNVLE